MVLEVSAGARRLAVGLARDAAAVRSGAAVLVHRSESTGWEGVAAEAFRRALDQLALQGRAVAAELDRAAAATRGAAEQADSELVVMASVLGQGQRLAGDALSHVGLQR